MQSEIKSNFEKSLSEGNYSTSQKEIKEKNFNKFIDQGFPNKRIEDWKFSDLNQIISTNFKKLDFIKKIMCQILMLISLVILIITR